MSELSDTKNYNQYSLPERIFIKASLVSPSSVTAQAAFIAVECKNNNIEPVEYANLLKEDDEAKDRIIRAANIGHRHLTRQKKRNADLSDVMAAGIFNYCFSLAQDFKTLDNDILAKIYKDHYSEYIATENPIDEDEFEGFVRKKYGLDPKTLRSR